ncbi:MAG: PDZ domain-containing protein [Clostridiales bacterium]|nr:PDZ domain-containing protein [Clostridiales bacterium]
MAGFIKLLFTAFSQSITSFLYLLIIMAAYLQIKRRAQLEETWLSFMRDTVMNRLMYVMLYGMIAGLITSSLIILTGIHVDISTIIVIWPLALLLTFLNERYLCFSYAGGIIALISLLFGWPKIDVSGVISIIGILHFTESILIILDGHRDALPVIMEHKQFKPIGAFVLSRLWPVPLVVLIRPDSSIPILNGLLSTPNWWLSFGLHGEGELMLFPLAILLEYSGLAITARPKERTRSTGLLLGAYSLLILGIGILSSNRIWLQVIGAIIMPVLHETILHYSRSSQLGGKPLFGAPWRGLRVLEVLPENLGQYMGIIPGDVLLNVNGKKVNSEEMLEETLNRSSNYMWIDLSRDGRAVTVEYRTYKRDKDKLGVLFVPRKTSRLFLAQEQHGLAYTLWKRIIEHKHTKEVNE